MKPNRFVLTTLALAIAAAAAGPACAAEDATAAAIKRLEAELARQAAQLESQRRQIEAQRAEIESLRHTVAASGPPSATTGTPAATTEQAVTALGKDVAELKSARQQGPKLAITAGRPTITDADGRSSIALRAVTQLDAAWYDQDEQGPLATDFRRGSVGATSNRELNSASDLSSGSNFRRARLGVEGIFARDFGYKFMAEYGGSGAESQTRINDAWVSYTGFAPFTLQAGAYAPPANLDDGTSADDTLFVERATPVELSRALAGSDGRVAATLKASGARWMGAFSLTGGTAGEGESFDEQRAVMGRAGFLALTGADYNVHLGLNGSYVFRPADQGGASGRYSIRLRDRPEIRVDGTRLVDTGPIDADSAYAAGVEFGAAWRNVYLQAENFWYGMERRDHALEDPDFGGWYVQGSWILTGESRKYSPANGAFQAPRPELPFSLGGGPGAWELALRYSHTDLDFDAGGEGLPATPDAVRGGEQDILAVGLNWTLTPNFKLVLDYLHVDVDRLNPATASSLPWGPAPATPPVGVDIGQELDIYSLRSQFSF